MKNDIQINATYTFCKPLYTMRYSYYAKGRTTEKLRFNSLLKQKNFSFPKR